ncbi:hypothetical protein, conserved [Babesia bigemina]|uniref:Uncharacterized protein n=1 Tax=Babesia bigemina TaxID=5866 RepID=A0A061DBA2_BABBI|nr:hypothetical protein, conserved [Babesia bigemina]CDR96189.1 hypothetical protein, conserved [Babesia bigemina]|eukprot:XP_012768375.1 hypothetical protein, conserved [Babesia bigemina]
MTRSSGARYMQWPWACVRPILFVRSSASIGLRREVVDTQSPSGSNVLRLTRRFAGSVKEVSPVVQIDSKGSRKFVYDNFGRLRVFFKFLIFQSIPLAIFAYCYRRFEKERQCLYSIPLETVDEALRHLWSITRNAHCFLQVGGKFYIVNYSVGSDAGFRAVDTLEGFVSKFQRDHRDALRNIYVSYPNDRNIDSSIESENNIELLFYNQSLDSFASVKAVAHIITDPGHRKQAWNPKLGPDTNNLAILNTKAVRIGFGNNNNKSIAFENKGDWILSK